MKKVLFVSLVIVVFAAIGYAKSPAIPTVPDATCTVNSPAPGQITCSWSTIPGALRYVIDVTAGFDVDSNCASDTWDQFDYSIPQSPTPSITFTINDLLHEVCPNTCYNLRPNTIDAIAIKAMTVPSKGGGRSNGSQNNGLYLTTNVWTGPCD